MSRTASHPLHLHRRLKNWAIGAAIVALAAWLFEFSTHLHLPDSHESGAPSAAHVCAYCAGMQIGAGPPASVVSLSVPAAVERVAAECAKRVLQKSAPSPYRSRAPPGF